jgi:signal transduction histidine kinase
MRGTGRLATFSSRLRAPRTVRLRLTAFCGAVVFVAGASLLAITFFLGTRRHVAATSFAISGSSGPRPGGALSSGPGPIVGSGNSVTIFSSGGSHGTGFSISQVRSAAEFGSSSAVHQLLVWGGISLVIVTLLGIGLGWMVSGRMLRPIRMMTNTTQQISEENLHQRLGVAGPNGDELKELGDTIDGLLARLESAFDTQGRFVQNASHELRTPIAMMRTSLDVATGKPSGVPPEVSVLAGKLREGLDQAEQLLESFLILARVQAGPAFAPSEVALSDLVVETIEARQDAIDARGLALQLDLGDAVAFGSETLLVQVASNLIDNAVRHNERGGWLRIATEADGALTRLVVENGGPRLDPHRVDLLGQPFQRIAADRTVSEHGAGLGLSIVAAIAASHGGRLVLRARDEGGLRVTVELPAAATQPLSSSDHR